MSRQLYKRQENGLGHMQWYDKMLFNDLWPIMIHGAMEVQSGFQAILRRLRCWQIRRPSISDRATWYRFSAVEHQAKIEHRLTASFIAWLSWLAVILQCWLHPRFSYALQHRLLEPRPITRHDTRLVTTRRSVQTSDPVRQAKWEVVYSVWLADS